MGRIFLIVVSLILAACTNGNLTTSYSTINYKFFYIGGSTDVITVKSEVFYSPDNGVSWSQISNLPVAIYAAAALYSQGKIIVAGGYNGAAAISSVYVSSDKGLTWSLAGNLPAIRFGGQMVEYSGRIFYIGGSNGSAQSTIYYSTDLGTTWTPCVTGLPAARFQGGAAVYNNYIYYAGGENGSMNSTVYKTNDPSCATAWSADTSLPSAVGRMDMSLYNNKLWIAGGYNYTGPTTYNNVWEGAVSGAITWTNHAGSLPSVRFGASTLGTSNAHYVVGGYDYTTLYSSVLKSTDGYTFTQIGSLPAGRLYGALVAVPPQ